MRRNVFALFISTVLLFQQCFFFVPAAEAADADIVVTEIAAYESSGCEWIEIFHTGTETVSLEGWRFWENDTNHGLVISSSSLHQDWTIEPGEYAIIAQDDARLFSSDCAGYASPDGTVFDSSWGSLNEGGELIGLKTARTHLLNSLRILRRPIIRLSAVTQHSPSTREQTGENTRAAIVSAGRIAPERQRMARPR